MLKCLKTAILLPRNNYITKLIMLYYHERHLHGGVQLLLSAIRQNYWIVKCKISNKENHLEMYKMHQS